MRLSHVVAAAVALTVTPSAGLAQDGAEAMRANGISADSIAPSHLQTNGDPGHHRKMPAERGIIYSLTYTIDVLASVNGGQSREAAALTGLSRLIRDFEANLEVSYAAQIVPGWILQPIAAYIWHPSGAVGRDATAIGARTVLKL